MIFDNKKIMKDDPLWPMYLVSLGMLQRKPVRVIFEASLLICFIIFAVELYTLLGNFSLCLKYGPWMMIKQFGFLSLVTLLNDLEALGNMWQHLERWTLDSAGSAVEKAIAKNLSNHHKLMMGIFALIGAYGMLVALPNSSDNQLYLIQLLFKESYPKYAGIFCLFGKAAHAPICWGMLMFPITVIYGVQHTIFQSKLFMEHLRNLGWDFDSYNDSQLLANPEYQKLMRERLKFCIKRHVDFTKGLNGYVLPIVHKWFPWYVVSGTLIGIGLGMWMYSLYNNIIPSTLHNVGMVAALNAVVLIVFCRLIHAGQNIEDKSGEFLPNLIEMRWPSWNKSNRMTLVLMMQRSDPLKIYFLENMAMNYELGIGMARSIYSVISLFVTIRSST